METKARPHAKHLGRKVSRLREFLGIKQETVADQLGISQQAVSKLEQSEHIEEATLERIGKVLGVSAEAIKNFSEEAVIYNIQNNYDSANPSVNFPQQCTFNPLDKYIEAVEEIKNLNAKNESLYQSLLKEKDEKIALLQKVLEGKK